MRCVKCGSYVENDSLFCAACGSPLAFVKPGNERVWGLILIILAVANVFLSASARFIGGFFANSFGLNLIVIISPVFAMIWAPLALLLLGIFGMQFIERCGVAGLSKKQLSGLATPDIAAGILLILYAIINGIQIFLPQYLMYEKGYDASHMSNIIWIFDIASWIIIISAMVFYFIGAGVAKKTRGLSPTPYLLSAIALGGIVFFNVIAITSIQPMLFNHMIEHGLSNSQYSLRSFLIIFLPKTLIIGFFFATRGVFWRNAAKRMFPNQK